MRGSMSKSIANPPRSQTFSRPCWRVSLRATAVSRRRARRSTTNHKSTIQRRPQWLRSDNSDPSKTDMRAQSQPTRWHVKFALSPMTIRSATEALTFVKTGQCDLGVAWRKEAKETPKPYLRVLLDDPSFAGPVNAALFDRVGKADLVWSRPKREAA